MRSGFEDLSSVNTLQGRMSLISDVPPQTNNYGGLLLTIKYELTENSARSRQGGMLALNLKKTWRAESSTSLPHLGEKKVLGRTGDPSSWTHS